MPATRSPRRRPRLTAAAEAPGTTKLLGLFHTGNMDGVLDRKFLKGGTVKKFPDQPDLTEQVQRRARRAVAQPERASS